jgi:predicted DNA-binding transcriptional regulator YafY
MMQLEAGGKVKGGELARNLEVSLRTIQRDMDILAQAGVPLYAETGPDGGYRLTEGYSFDTRTFYHNELLNLYLCGIGVRLQDHRQAVDDLHSALLKMEKSLPQAYTDLFKKARQRFFFDPDPWWEYKKPLADFENIRTALWRGVKLRLEYSNLQNRASTRTVRPLGLVVKDRTWYLAAFCELREERRIFLCERIQKASLSDETFEYPQDFDLAQYWQRSKGAFYRLITDRQRVP